MITNCHPYSNIILDALSKTNDTTQTLKDHLTVIKNLYCISVVNVIIQNAVNNYFLLYNYDETLKNSTTAMLQQMNLDYNLDRNYRIHNFISHQ